MLAFKVLTLMIIGGTVAAVWAADDQTSNESRSSPPPLAPVRHAQRLQAKIRARPSRPSSRWDGGSPSAGGITGNNGDSAIFSSGGSTGSVLISPEQVDRGSGFTGHSNLAHQTLSTNDQNRLVPIGQPAQRTKPKLRPAVAIREKESDDEMPSPKPYQYSFETEDPKGTLFNREERTDGNGAVVGSYTIRDPYGMIRIVNYVADDQGFRAEIQSNEPGMVNSNPANVKIKSIA